MASFMYIIIHFTTEGFTYFGSYEACVLVNCSLVRDESGFFKSFVIFSLFINIPKHLINNPVISLNENPIQIPMVPPMAPIIETKS